ncbi:hypothetical protein BFJ68_g16746 [Fusarium oxysporum]|uniref:Uncharacterized protein n=1 Tax=Fusarium oxysporum TaxID=5507 RepID=A0A420P9V6_FUSOX|nr:hypothetical protein BFJ68_g16746 [Fusarium oxysporum]
MNNNCALPQSSARTLDLQAAMSKSGANIEIKVNGQLQALPNETRLRTASEDEESDSDSDVDGQTAAGGSNCDENEHRGSQESGLFMGESGGSSEDNADGSSGPPGGSRPAEDDEDDDGVEAQRDLYSDRLERLRTKLEQKYNLDHIDQVSYALAADINHSREGGATTGRGSDDDDEVESSADTELACLLADHCQVSGQYHGARQFTFYPLGFH